MNVGLLYYILELETKWAKVEMRVAAHEGLDPASIAQAKKDAGLLERIGNYIIDKISDGDLELFKALLLKNAMYRIVDNKIFVRKDLLQRVVFLYVLRFGNVASGLVDLVLATLEPELQTLCGCSVVELLAFLFGFTDEGLARSLQRGRGLVGSLFGFAEELVTVKHLALMFPAPADRFVAADDGEGDVVRLRSVDHLLAKYMGQDWYCWRRKVHVAGEMPTSSMLMLAVLYFTFTGQDNTLAWVGAAEVEAAYELRTRFVAAHPGRDVAGMLNAYSILGAHDS